MRKNAFALTVAALAVAVPMAQAGPILYDFIDGDAFDGGGVGATLSKTDGTTTVALTTADVQAPQYSGTTLTGSQTSAAGRSGFVAGLNTTNTAGTGATQMGVNNITISDSNGTTAGIGSAEAASFNVNEAWLFSFDTEITFTQMDLTSIEAVDTVTVTVGNLGSFTFTDPTDPNDAGDIYNDPFNGLVIPANTEITFKNTTTGTASSVVRIDSFTVTPTPEPASLAVLGLGGLLLAQRRRAGR